MGIRLAHYIPCLNLLSCLLIIYIYRILDGVFQEFLFLHEPKFHYHIIALALQLYQIGVS